MDDADSASPRSTAQSCLPMRGDSYVEVTFSFSFFLLQISAHSICAVYSITRGRTGEAKERKLEKTHCARRACLGWHSTIEIPPLESRQQLAGAW